MKKQLKTTDMPSENQEEDTIDIIALLKTIWISRKWILKTVFVFMLLGLFVAVFSKDEYTASTTFVPANQGEGTKGSLGSLASLAGISLGGANAGTEISPELYPQIVKSIPFQLELLDTKLTIDGQEKPVSYKEYYDIIYSAGVLGNIKKYTVGLPAVILSLFRVDAKEEETFFQENQILSLSQENSDLIKQLTAQISLEVNDKEGFVTISATLPEATASAQLTLKAQTLLQDYVLKFKTQKAIEQLHYIEDRYLEKQQEFTKIKIEFARFQDQNNAVNTALGKIKLLQLQSDYDLVFSVYTELAKQLETQRLQVKKDTPLFTVLKPVNIPIEKSAPKRFLILVVYSFLGLVLSIGYVLVRPIVLNVKKDFIN
ncbi:Tyrosine-protein kinase etk [Polaribacter huanghezhanensis]|uniref:Wzz/FepE/Etk N-terminal domain-containing protein n=1 Tax=Polaribacter huanghezhanensis TaxID=1354726 RepID=UPI002647D3F5|nr:Wzz/FepE/Etk N-terminal domain-containing protein [Polaribacter huanghezhanensis]WKD86094.1 Tyrosine-protein kinase etk [Polaribacter huanghezhanensis]